ncbi:hypothetical protein M9Y10_033511 [Tritrichomonas musculus]|uniref:CNH domain-containing protein n=1 Tax=Tritrichomonas musculus TaxID=1915356 RepID=A0ABR2KCC5_9EUKA
MISHQYAGIQLHLTLKMDSKTVITAMTHHQNHLVIALEPFVVYLFPLEFRNNTIIQSGKRKEILKKVNDIRIKQLCSFDNTLLVLVQGKSTKGLLYTLTEDGKLAKIIDKVSCFAVNQYSNEKYIIVGFNQQLFLYKFTPEKTCILCNDFPKELDSKIEAVSISYPYSIILTQEKMYSINLADQTINSNISSCIPAPYTMPLSHDFFFTHYAHSSIKLDRNLSSNISPISFEENPIDHSYNGTLIATVMSKQISIYNFEGYKGIAYVTNPSHITQFNGQFIYSTKVGIFYLSEVTSQIDDIVSGFISENVNFDTDTLLSIFEQLWLSKRKDYALSLFKFEKTQSELIPKILQLFDFFVLPFDGDPFMEVGEFDTKEIYRLLYYELDSLDLFQPDQIEFVNTAKFELLAEMNDLKTLSSFLEKNPNIKMIKEMIDQFYQKAKSKSERSLVLDSYPYYLLYLGKADDALDEFLKSKNYDDFSHALIQKASDFNFVEERLDVLINNAPLKAIDVLTCDQISSQKSIELVKKKYPMYLTPVLRKIIDHKGIIDREEIANFYVTQMFSLITLINQLGSTPKFDRTLFQFTNSVINNPNASSSEISDELNQLLCEFIIKYRSIIDPSILANNISKFISFDLKLEIFKTTKDYERIFQLLSENENDYGKCEKFVGNEKDTDILRLFLVFVKNNLNNAKSPKIDDFPGFIFNILANFIEFIDIESTLELIGGEFDDKFFDLIESAYSKVNTQRMNTEIKASFAESDVFESLYNRTTLESNCVTLDSEKTCSYCNNPLGYRFVQLTPDGRYYHNKCIKQVKRKSSL